MHRYIKSIDKGLLKVMSKMGISTYQSYCGAQIFDAVGLRSDFVDRDFFGTATTIEGVGMLEIAEETVCRHRDAFGNAPVYRDALDVGGEYLYRLRGEQHVWNPDTVAALQHAVRLNAEDRYREFARLVNEQENHLKTLRGLFRIRNAEETGRAPVPLTDVEPAGDIVRRFATGAMSFGSISKEAHETLALAMNALGAKSNTGEGGEEPERFRPLPDGRSKRSAIKQVASGRFGVTTEYLVNSDVMQIKIAQGAKPGEGGQLPGHKVDAKIARVRHSTPGVALISPPPHHDIYSIEDLAQLIFDLKNVNPKADVSVKLVAEVGVGTVAAGVAKARADHITISGFEGGTGASPLTSIKHAGSPWEIGLAETQQTLVLNRLRGRVALQVDGGLRTGRDVIIGALLGADEFGFSTAPLIAAGCIMMRKCHLNTCPVGVATQDPVLRKRFKGLPEHVINYFFFVAEEVRECLAAMGFRRLEEVIGCSDLLDKVEAIDHWKAKGLDFSRIFKKPEVGSDVAVRHTERQHHPIDNVLDRRLIAEARGAIETGEPVTIEASIRNVDRTVGAMLSGEIAVRHGHEGLPDDTVCVKLTGTAGQSFGSWLAAGVTLILEGEANDYVGKGLSGGKLIVKPSPRAKAAPERSIIVGNTVLYGAISGECYFRGVAGERFAVRNSGAIAVVEGTGDHGCEYMTGRRRRRDRPDGPQLRGWHVGRHRLRARRGRHLRQALQPVDGRSRARRGGGGPHDPPPPPWRRPRDQGTHRHPGRHVGPRRGAAHAAPRQPLQIHRLGARAGDPRRLGDLPDEVRQGDAGRIPPRAARDGDRSACCRRRSDRAMKLIGMLDSPFVRRVAVTLAARDIPFEHESISVLPRDGAVRRGEPAVQVALARRGRRHDPDGVERHPALDRRHQRRPAAAGRSGFAHARGAARGARPRRRRKGGADRIRAQAA